MSQALTPEVPLTLEQAKDWFYANGESVSDWAKARGFRREIVYAVLAGRTRGCRGEAHRVAVALGLKAPPPDQTPLGGAMS